MTNNINRKTVSVAMAAYNGESYIKEQIDSIIVQLSENDELIISYNESGDNTYYIISEYEETDNRVRIFKCSEKGVISNFENAIANCKNEIIFLSDQDDVWYENKINYVLSCLEQYSVGAIVHKSLLVDENLVPIENLNINKKKHLISAYKILKKNYVQGCCIAFEQQYVNKILPFPRNIPMHDSWIALIISTIGDMLYIDVELQIYRQHRKNVTCRHHKPIREMISDRLILFIEYKKRIKEIKEC